MYYHDFCSHSTGEENKAQRSWAKEAVCDRNKELPYILPQVENADTFAPLGPALQWRETPRTWVVAMKMHLSDFRLALVAAFSYPQGLC